MSTPISTIHEATNENTVDAENTFSTETGSTTDEAVGEALTEATTTTADVDEDATDAADEAPSEKRTGTSLIALVLAGLLLGSIALNLNQSRQVSNLEARSGEYQQALAAAVDRIDSEASRADGAEAALTRVDVAVDVVNERVLGLQEALDGLRDATVR